jgi:molybdopterin/thiamine biosynthesis adenylyltransferase
MDGDVGRVRSEAVAERLATVNAGGMTAVEALPGPLAPARDIHLGCGFHVVVSTGDDMDAHCAIDEVCRAAGVAFIFAHAPGLFAFTFVDLGDEWLVGYMV